MAFHYDSKTNNIYTLEEWRDMQERAAEADFALLKFLFLLALKIVRAGLHFFLGLLAIANIFFHADIDNMFSHDWIIWAWLGISVVHLIFINKNVTRIVVVLLLIVNAIYFF